MATFIEMVTDVTTELRRSNLTTEAKQAINDAIEEAAKTRLYFNGMRGQTFNSVIGTEYYDDMGLVEIDSFWYVQSGVRYNIDKISNDEINCLADGNQINGLPQVYSRTEDQQVRLYPVPNLVLPFYMDGYGKLSPFPLTADADTNAWLTSGRRYIKLAAKALLLKEVIRDYGEARAIEAQAQDVFDKLVSETTMRLGTSHLRATDW